MRHMKRSSELEIYDVTKQSETITCLGIISAVSLEHDSAIINNNNYNLVFLGTMPLSSFSPSISPFRALSLLFLPPISLYLRQL